MPTPHADCGDLQSHTAAAVGGNGPPDGHPGSALVLRSLLPAALAVLGVERVRGGGHGAGGQHAQRGRGGQAALGGAEGPRPLLHLNLALAAAVTRPWQRRTCSGVWVGWRGVVCWDNEVGWALRRGSGGWVVEGWQVGAGTAGLAPCEWERQSTSACKPSCLMAANKGYSGQQHLAVQCGVPIHRHARWLAGTVKNVGAALSLFGPRQRPQPGLA